MSRAAAELPIVEEEFKATEGNEEESIKVIEEEKQAEVDSIHL